MKFADELVEAKDDNFEQLMKDINKNIDSAIARKDKKTLDRLTKDLEKILKDLKSIK